MIFASMFHFDLSDIGATGHAVFSDLLPFIALIVGIGVLFWILDYLIQSRDPNAGGPRKI
jgi:hypothetical protein